MCHVDKVYITEYTSYYTVFLTGINRKQIASGSQMEKIQIPVIPFEHALVRV